LRSPRSRNFSRAADGGGFVVHTGVTIGYATPWRQVHAMLLEAARRTPGLAAHPAPYVLQTALSDFYVEYRLVANGEPSSPAGRAEAMSALHASVLDVFNEYGVQIMSPHYIADPPDVQVVPKAHWFDPPAAPDQPSGTARRET
jgi:small-conductance mechanosensitive channel